MSVSFFLLSPFVSNAATASLTLERVRLEHRVRDGVPGAARVSMLMQTPQRLLSAILLGNNLVNTGAAAVGTVIAAEFVSEGAGVVVATLAVTMLLVVFGEVGPKTIALHHGFRLSRVYALPLQGWSLAVAPGVGVLDQVSRRVLRLVRGEEGPVPAAPELAAAFQEAVVDALVTKTLAAARDHDAVEVILVGGVAANSVLRRSLSERSPLPVRIPSAALCTDNGAMIAACGWWRLQAGETARLDVDVQPGLRIG